MTEEVFFQLNERLRKRQAAIREARRKSEPVHIQYILSAVMADIRRRMEKARAKV